MNVCRRAPCVPRELSNKLSLTDVAYFPKQIKILRKDFSPTFTCFLQTSSPVRLVIHVFAGMLVIIVPVAVAVALPFIHHLSYLHASMKLPLSRVGGGCSFQPSASAGILHIAVFAVWISPPPHTPLNASLLLQHIIFADHKIHPQRFPGRT